MIQRPIRTAVAGILLVVMVLLAGTTGPTLYQAYKQYRKIERRLPDLPPVTASREHRAGFPTKVWLHRVNSVERARLMAKEYRGLEVDVVYDTVAGDYDVGHPPTPSLGIALGDIFSSVPDVGEHYFWLDFKNLDERDADQACARLTSVAGQHGIVSHVIVESTEPRALSCFAEHGFYTSYYLFPDDDLPHMSRRQVADYYEAVKANLLASKVNAVSSDYRYLPFIEKYFPAMDALVWYLDGTGRSLGNRAMVAWLARKDQVKVILVHRSSVGYR